ncbi:MAG: 3-carboxymuconate cyclase [Verrucomicrobiaceae bacterium]|nr:3-carboxymuconate cyclase [Verrucomicrobiaceae bacterium]
MKMILATIRASLLLSFCSLPAQAGITKVYLGTQGRGESKGIYVCDLDTRTGTLSSPRLAATLGGCGFLAIHPGKKHLYSTARGDGNNVAAFHIKDDYGLEPINVQPSEGTGPCHVSLDATGSCLMVANYGSGSVAAFGIDEDGSLLKSSSAHQHEGSSINERRQKGPHAHSIYAGPDNKFAYAPDLGIDKVMIYRLNPEKAIMEQVGAAETPAGSGPRHMKFSKDGKQAYVLTELHLTVAVYDRDPTSGLLGEVRQNVPTLAKGADLEGMSCSEIRVHPNGKFLYAANRDVKGSARDSISVFKVISNGRIQLIQNIPAKVSVPRNIGVDPGGNWLLVAGQRSGNVPVFRIAGNGTLVDNKTEVKVANAMCVEFLVP